MQMALGVAGWTAMQLASYKAAQHLHAVSASLLKLQKHLLGSPAQQQFPSL